MTTLRIILVELTSAFTLSQLWTFLDSCHPENLGYVVVLGNVSPGIRLAGYEEMVWRLERYGEIMYAEVRVEKEGYNCAEIMGVIASMWVERAV